MVSFHQAKVDNTCNASNCYLHVCGVTIGLGTVHALRLLLLLLLLGLAAAGVAPPLLPPSPTLLCSFTRSAGWLADLSLLPALAPVLPALVGECGGRGGLLLLAVGRRRAGEGLAGVVGWDGGLAAAVRVLVATVWGRRLVRLVLTPLPAPHLSTKVFISVTELLR